MSPPRQLNLQNLSDVTILELWSLIHATAGMNLEDTVLGEISQAQLYNYCIIPPI